jgi:hypothetical protein
MAEEHRTSVAGGDEKMHKFRLDKLESYFAEMRIGSLFEFEDSIRLPQRLGPFPGSLLRGCG